LKELILGFLPFIVILPFLFVLLRSKQPAKDYILFCLFFYPVIYSADRNFSVFQVVSYLYLIYSFRNNRAVFSYASYGLSLYFLIVLFVSAFNSEFVLNAIFGILKFLPILIYIHVLLSELLRNQEFLYEVVRALKITLIIAIVFLFLQIVFGLNFSLFLSDNPNITYEGIRYPGIFQDPQKFAQFLAALSFVVLISQPNNPSFSKYNYYLFALAIISLFLTGGRSALLGLILGLIFIIAFSKAKVKVLGIIGGVVVIGLIVSLSQYLIVFSREESITESYAVRNAIWQEALKIVADKPLLGIGMDNYSKYVERYAPEQSWLVDGEKVYFDHPESGYLKFLTELGILGTLGVFAFIFSAIYRGLRVFLLKVKDYNILYLISALLSWLLGFYSVYSFGDVRISILIATIICLIFAYVKMYSKGVTIISE